MNEPIETGCVCPLAGYCARHQMQKHPIWHHNCRTKPKWFDYYERGGRHEAYAGSGPPSVSAEVPSEGLGDTLAKVFRATGVAWFVERAAKVAGLKGCGCAERKRLLNELLPYRPAGLSEKHWTATIQAAAKVTATGAPGG